ncbi:transmembrane and coiled-coil domain-containing protein 5B isoform X3 [Pongo abelii]|uniref:transmembrane and coiled-coil domain-containing protein 5B isoform X3 n=1 Tax=Pongo abelii TaxID=9601 RepID=UPI0023E7B465|nr:transmembrane and coiled-coil domain-containing protein 5B isoform X3 [Pongo abelii]
MFSWKSLLRAEEISIGKRRMSELRRHHHHTTLLCVKTVERKVKSRESEKQKKRRRQEKKLKRELKQKSLNRKGKEEKMQCERRIEILFSTFLRDVMMEDVGQNPLADVYQTIELPALEAVKQNLDCLNSDLEKDLQKLDMENQVLLRKIKEKEETIPSLERELALSLEEAKEEEELNYIIDEQEESLRQLELETAKLEKSNAILSRNVVEIQKKISGLFTNIGLEEETTKQILEEMKARLQKSTESCAKQEEELAEIESDYQSVSELCKDQVYYIKKYQEVLRKMKEEKEALLLEKEILRSMVQTGKPTAFRLSSCRPQQLVF